MRRALRGVAVCLLPVLVGLYVAATTFGGGRFVPWRPVMVDLDVYRRAGSVLLQGGDFYTLPGALQFLYPPFAALLAAPLALLPATVAQVGWTVAGVLALLAVLHRFGLHGWVLSLVGTAAVWFVEPVTETLAFGQLGIFLVALVVLDLVPGPRVGRHRLLPEGVLTALAAAVKLTPAIFVVQLLVVRRTRALVTAVVTGLAVTLASAVVAPRASRGFWGRLAHGDTGLGGSIIYYTNQSVMADVVRVLGLGGGAAALGLALSALVAALGVWAGSCWYRRGDVALAVTLCGVASLLASPVSWLHHFVWVVPLALCLVQHSRGRDAEGGPLPPLPAWFTALGWTFVGWVVASPFRRLPNGADVELQWTAAQHALASTTAVLGVALLVGGVVVGRRRTRADRPTDASTAVSAAGARRGS
ncbi:alpha-1,2-mannosyltransferase [Friedmanniella luteola]|uniref:Alpha-1,2-mannosyltransferase n=1 Tax=Friedmanniella luteola TaxID=546871 RepID=A0A1H1W755_9ACTN|nr:glycosyltransferase 87 family protein [Friedmanniella luteola]SDS93007.1 alpha-1,2-mannosyltransferase [Friedmanniella luteola]